MTGDRSLEAARATNVRWLILVLACALSWLLYLHRYAWGVIRPYVQAESPELTDVEFGWLAGLFMAAYGIGQMPGGLAGDRLGPRLVLPVLVVLWSGCVAWLALARGLWQLAAVILVFGLAQAGAYPNLSKVTRSWFPLRSRTTAQGLVASLSGRAGGACAPLLIAAVMIGSWHFSWREAVLTLAGAGVFFALAFALLFRNSPREHPWVNDAERHLVEEGAGPAAPTRPPRVHLTRGSVVALAALLLYAFASSFVDQLYVFWIPQFLVEGKRLSETDMGIFAGLPLWGGALGGVVGGMLNDVLIRRTGSRRWGRAGVAFSGKLLAAVFIVASVGVADGRLVMVLLLACKFFGDWSLATQWGTITDISGRAAGTVFGLVNMAGSVGAFLAGPAIGYLKQRFGWEGLFLTLGGVYLVAALCWLGIDCTRPIVIEDERDVSTPRSNGPGR